MHFRTKACVFYYRDDKNEGGRFLFVYWFAHLEIKSEVVFFLTLFLAAYF